MIRRPPPRATAIALPLPTFWFLDRRARFRTGGPDDDPGDKLLRIVMPLLAIVITLAMVCSGR